MNDEPQPIDLLAARLDAAGCPTTVIRELGDIIARPGVERRGILLIDLTSPSAAEVTIELNRQYRWRETFLVAVGDEPPGARAARLNDGIDGYLSTPLDLDEASARLHALQRRLPVHLSALEVGDLRLSRRDQRAWRGDREMHLSPTEFRLLWVLAANQGTVLSPRSLHSLVWGRSFAHDSRNLSVYVGYLRRKTEWQGDRRIVHTRRGVGYVLRP